MTIHAEVARIFDRYPAAPQKALYQLRALILEVAKKENVDCVESLKWGEASYACPQGSPVRIDWKEKHPKSISLYFNCNTSIVETIRALMGDRLDCVGNREIKLPLEQALPQDDLQLCLTMAMTYKKIKHLPLLGF